MTEQNKHDLFDRYLRGELQNKELDAFLEWLKRDSDLRDELEMHQLIVEGIKQYEREELKKYLKKRGRVRFMGNPFSKSFTILSAAVILFFGIVYIVLETNNLGQELAEQSTSKEPNREEPIDTVEDLNNRNGVKKGKPVEKQPKQSNDDTQQGEESGTTDGGDIPEARQPEVIDFDLTDDNLPVKGDVRLHERVITIQAGKTPQIDIDKKDSSDVDGIRRKEFPIMNQQVVVQFWQSPINYKGYKFDGRKLELFGLDSFEIATLKYRVVDANLRVYEIYLKYGNDFFRLEDNNRYLPYVKETNPQILEELK